MRVKTVRTDIGAVDGSQASIIESQRQGGLSSRVSDVRGEKTRPVLVLRKRGRGQGEIRRLPCEGKFWKKWPLTS